jgi:hypothetical protein
MYKCMHKITLISTVHMEIGQCNADELFYIITEINPDVIFLEALESCYSKYDQLLFSSNRIYHKRLEIQAIQKYSQNRYFEYVPVLDKELSSSFDIKYNLVFQSAQLQRLLNDFNSFAEKGSFQFLNSDKAIGLHDEMRTLEKNLLKDNEIQRKAVNDLLIYEDSMIRNIYSYCKENLFNAAIFMCGNAHRKSLINKIEDYNKISSINLNWEYY